VIDITLVVVKGLRKYQVILQHRYFIYIPYQTATRSSN